MKKAFLAMMVASVSLVSQFSLAISADEIPVKLKPRVMAELISECGLEKNDNYIQFLNRMIVELGKSDKITPKFVKSVAEQAIKKYKLADKPSCIDLGVSLLESGILNQNSYHTLLPIKLKRDEAYMSAAFRGIVGDVDVPGRRSDFAFLVAQAVRKTYLEETNNYVSNEDPRWTLFELGTIKGSEDLNANKNKDTYFMPEALMPPGFGIN